MLAASKFTVRFNFGISIANTIRASLRELSNGVFTCTCINEANRAIY